MQMGSSRSGFDRIQKDLVLPIEMREELRVPLGEVVVGEELAQAVSDFHPVVAVGDVCTRILLDTDVPPDIAVVDFKSKREPEDALRSRLSGWRTLRVKNPAGTISVELWNVVSEAFKSKERVTIEVVGEEDLAALPCIIHAPDGAVVVYGLPDRGAVVVPVTEAKKEQIWQIIERMAGNYGD